VHATEILTSADFAFTVGGHKAFLEDVFPRSNEHDRIGVVVRWSGGATGASSLLMAAMTRFYDFHRSRLGNERGNLRIYPECFVFHIGERRGNYRRMDVWPPHREVVVEDDPEQILEAINDRGVTRLLVEDATPSSTTFLRETISSTGQRIVSALAHSPTGRVDQADVTVMSSSAAEGYVLAALDESKGLSEDVEKLQRGRQTLLSDGRVTETYRRIARSDAIRMLPRSFGPGPTTRRFIAESHPNAPQHLP
jgi:hypothetical protein